MVKVVAYPESVSRAIAGTGPTPPLADYLAAMRLDDNVCWRLRTGHLVGLLEEACEALGLS